MNDDLTKSLLLLHKEAFRLKKMEDSSLIGSVNEVVKFFNSTLSSAKAKFQGNSLLSSVSEMRPTPVALRPIAIWQAHGKAEELYLSTCRIMNALGIEIKEPDEQAAPLVQLAITQQVSQFMNFNYDQLIQVIQQQRVESNVIQGAELAVNQFRDEIAKPKPDATKLKSYLNKVMVVGREFAVPLLIKVLENWDKIFSPSTSVPK